MHEEKAALVTLVYSNETGAAGATCAVLRMCDSSLNVWGQNSWPGAVAGVIAYHMTLHPRACTGCSGTFDGGLLSLTQEPVVDRDAADVQMLASEWPAGTWRHGVNVDNALSKPGSATSQHNRL